MALFQSFNNYLGLRLDTIFNTQTPLTYKVHQQSVFLPLTYIQFLSAILFFFFATSWFTAVEKKLLKVRPVNGIFSQQ